MNAKYILYLNKFNHPFKNDIVLFRLNRQARQEISSKILHSYKTIRCKCNHAAPDSKNPYFAEVLVNKELHRGGKTSCRHIEFNIKGSKIKYTAGDHLAIFPANDAKSIEKIGDLIVGDLETPFSATYTPQENLAANCTEPDCCTVCQALTFYLDITSPPSIHLLRHLCCYTTDADERKQLMLLSSTRQEAIKAYQENIIKKHKTVLDILIEMPSIKIDVINFCRLLPKMMPRYYSISSSPNLSPDIISITFDILKGGFATNWLLKKRPTDDENPLVPIFVRESKFRVPSKSKTSMVMICSGTGFAPFRSFIQERHCQFTNESRLGRTILFLGCKSRGRDFIYQDELEGYVDEGLLTLYGAFPKDDGVQLSDLLETYSEVIWDTICNYGHVYVCGSKNLEKVAYSNLIKIIQCHTESNRVTAIAYLKNLQTKSRYQVEVA